ncbi:MAG: YdcH family protein [Magnetococcales bacterium]|nr:YdcH family protein [Magnetococcales bacterium]MBF0149211.1 YdcH family protein [Magnetococcales bacterium]MBF0171977.1 YdcH family protein [Magnetococcales bacterium]MBF0349124.1 YdcH family protein [Magnetococcales bacterium]
MFEDQADLVQTLLANNDAFQALHQEHQMLKQQIAESGRTMDQFSVERLKKRKLQLKDQMAAMLAAVDKK